MGKVIGLMLGMVAWVSIKLIDITDKIGNWAYITAERIWQYRRKYNENHSNEN